MTPRELIEQQDARFLVSDNLRWWLMGILVGLLLLAVMGWRAEADAKIEQAERQRAQAMKAAREDRRKCFIAQGQHKQPPVIVEACVRTVSRM
jgi:hypothetical protein